jgi:hypothetical protein
MPGIICQELSISALLTSQLPAEKLGILKRSQGALRIVRWCIAGLKNE